MSRRSTGGDPGKAARERISAFERSGARRGPLRDLIAFVAMTPEEGFMRQALELALENVKLRRGRPFGAVLVNDSVVLATGVNETALSGDPTAHAELQAIREASRTQGLLRFEGCTMYASGHPCPMCLGAMYMTGVSAVFYAYSNEVAESYGLSTAKVYAELRKPIDAQSLLVRCLPLRLPGEDLYDAWRSLTEAVTVR